MPVTRANSLRRLGGVLQRAGEPIFLLDPQQRLVFANAAWEDLTARPIDQVLGLTCLPGNPEGPEGLAASFAPPPSVRAGQPGSGRTLILRPDGARLWRRIHFWPYHGRDSEPIGILGVVTPQDLSSPLPEIPTMRLRAELLGLRERLRQRWGMNELVGHGPAHDRLFQQIRAVATARCPALIVGEPGTGKNAIAAAIHQAGSRPDAPLVPVDCAALPPREIERILFGGPLPDESAARPELALPDGSTLLLRHVDALPRDLQAHVALAMSDQVQLLATTTTVARDAPRSDGYRPEFYYTLTALVIRLEPLRDRLNELPLLALHMLERAASTARKHCAGFDPPALQTLSAYDWPGNLSELSRVLQAAVARCEGDLLRDEHLPADIRGHLGAAYLPPLPTTQIGLDTLLTQIERRLIERALSRSRQNKSRAADLLGISRPRLYRRIKELNIPDMEPRLPEETDDRPGEPSPLAT